MKCILLAGGFGGSLWPLSRKDYPIQFAEICDGRSAFQENIARHLPYCDEFYIFTNYKYEYIVRGQLNIFQMLKYKLFLEEEAVNTTLPVILGLMYAKNENVLVLGCSSIYSGDGFRESFAEGIKAVSNSPCVMFGMPVEAYDENIGYINYNKDNVNMFLEKPDKEKICELFKKGSWMANTGKYLINTIRFLNLIKMDFSDIYNNVNKVYTECRTEDDKIIIPVGYKTDILNLSFEKNILSSLKNTKVIGLKNVECSVINNWRSVEKVIREEARTDIVKQNCDNVTVINNAENKLVVANGIKNTIIVNTDDAIYIEGESTVSDVKTFFVNHEDEYREYIYDNNFKYRSWGKYTVIRKSAGYVVKEVILYPGREMNLHKHEHRSEHWAVVEGTAEITIDDEVALYKENTSIFVPKGSYHKIANNTERNVVIIEIEIGENITESDIVSRNYVAKKSDKFEIMKMKPIFKDYIWGGTRLRDKFGKSCDWSVIAESWELSTHKSGSSIIDSGRFKGMQFSDFINEFGDKVVGWKCKAFSSFPILIKFIDSKKPLSIQVHPNDEFAMKNENEYGKNEMWYIVDCDEKAFIYCGFNRDISVEEFNERLKNKTLTQVLNKIPVKKGETYFIPAGTVHAICEGMLICEVQQNSNSTYRIYDYDRKDKDGNSRELHIDKALQVINFNKYVPYQNETAQVVDMVKNICSCKYFDVSIADIQGEREFYVDASSFYGIVVIEGQGFISDNNIEITFKKGDTMFVPAASGSIGIFGHCKVIIAHI